MLRDITLGQYFPADTVVHNLDPRTKLLLTIVYIVVLFIADTWLSYAFMFVMLICLVLASHINLKTVLKSLKPIAMVIVFTAVLNMFFTRGEVLYKLWIIQITREGLILSGKMVLRLILIITGTFMLTYTTSPVALTDGMEKLLNPLKKIRFPVHELSMMMSLALRFVPTLIEETNKIMSAQKARGADMDTGSIFKRARALVPILVPLFVSAFRRSDELAEAMEARCYHGGKGRTRMKSLGMKRNDGVAFALGAAVIAAVAFLNWQL